MIPFVGEKRHTIKKSSSGSSTTSSRISTAEIANIVEQLKLQQHGDSTRKNYYLVWRLFNDFFIKLDVKPTSWADRLSLFVGYLISNNKQSSTVKSYISTVKTVLKMNNINITEDNYLLSSLVHACRLKNNTVCTRFPIKKGMLGILLKQTAVHFDSLPYLSLLYRTLFMRNDYRIWNDHHFLNSGDYANVTSHREDFYHY